MKEEKRTEDGTGGMRERKRRKREGKEGGKEGRKEGRRRNRMRRERGGVRNLLRTIAIDCG